MTNTSGAITGRLRDGKAALRLDRQQASLDEKMLELWLLQKLYVELASVTRTLPAWQRPWDIRSDVRETVVFGDGASTPIRTTGSSSPLLPVRWVLAR